MKEKLTRVLANLLDATCFLITTAVLVCTLLVTIPVAFLLLVHSTWRTIRWFAQSNSSKRSLYKRWLSSELEKELGKFYSGAFVLHINGPNGFDWRSSQHLSPGTLPEYGGYRPVCIGSSDWHGYVRNQMRHAHFKFIRDEIFPVLGALAAMRALWDL